jgi:hypothetical protein
MNAARDAVGNRAKFVAPTVANGKVYLATFAGYVDVYGLLSSAATPTVTATSTPTTASGTPTATATPLPAGTLFSDTFEADGLGAAPSGWTATGGTWSVAQDQSHVTTETAAVTTAAELTAGNPAWTDYTESVDVKAPGGTAAFGIVGRWHDFNDTYLLLLRDGTTWQLAKRVAGTFSQLGSGTFSYAAGTWYTLKLAFSGTTITASAGNTVLATVKDGGLSSGEVGFHTLNMPEYDNVVVTGPGGGAPTTTVTSTSTACATAAPAATGTATATATGTATATATGTPTTGGTLYADSFEADQIGTTPGGWTSSSGGTWKVIEDQSHVAEQTATISGAAELTTGNAAWTSYTESVDVKAPGGTATYGITGRWHDFNDTYMLLLYNGTRWELAKRVGGTFTQMAYGGFTPVTGNWYTLKLAFNGTTITASIGGTVLATSTDSSLSSGMVGFRTSGVVEFDNVTVTSP